MDDPPVGPNGIRHFDQTLAAVATYPGSLTDRLDLMAAIDEFVFGFALMERTNFHDPANEPPAPLLDYLETLLDTEDLPALQEFAQEHGVSGGWAIISNHGRDPERFDRQLDRLIAGFDASR
ncbi:MAG: TetR/AcrR family transcriptional regulator C-terminal domain-containing protein [Ilumatobacteraceae bacterium]